LLAHVRHRARGFANAALRTFRRRLSAAVRPAATTSLVLGAATDLLRRKPDAVHASPM
jgi:hypothetical protein